MKHSTLAFTCLAASWGFASGHLARAPHAKKDKKRRLEKDDVVIGEEEPSMSVPMDTLEGATIAEAGDSKACPVPEPESEWKDDGHDHDENHGWPWPMTSGGDEPKPKPEETCAPSLNQCQGYSYYRPYPVPLLIPLPPEYIGPDDDIPHVRWTIAMIVTQLAGSFPPAEFGPIPPALGYTTDTCVLAPLPNRKELYEINAELREKYPVYENQNVQAGWGWEGGKPPAMWLGVTKTALAAQTDNFGYGSRDNWYNLDGTRAEVCDAGMWAGSSPDGQGGNARHVFLTPDGELKDLPDGGGNDESEAVVWALYRCCKEAPSFSTCGAKNAMM